MRSYGSTNAVGPRTAAAASLIVTVAVGANIPASMDSHTYNKTGSRARPATSSFVSASFASTMESEDASATAALFARERFTAAFSGSANAVCMQKAHSIARSNDVIRRTIERFIIKQTFPAIFCFKHIDAGKIS